jgi:hypothetical protein
VKKSDFVKSNKSDSFYKNKFGFCSRCSKRSFLSAIFTARNHRLLAFLLPKAAKGSKNALTPTS